MGAVIRILNSGSLWTGFVHITAVRTVILRGRQLKQCMVTHKTELLRHPLLPQPSFAFYIFLGLFVFGSEAFMLSHTPRGFLELH